MEPISAVVKLIANHQITVPKPIRDALGLQKGDLLEITVRKLENPTQERR